MGNSDYGTTYLRVGEDLVGKLDVRLAVGPPVAPGHELHPPAANLHGKEVVFRVDG